MIYGLLEHIEVGLFFLAILQEGSLVLEAHLTYFSTQPIRNVVVKLVRDESRVALDRFISELLGVEPLLIDKKNPLTFIHVGLLGIEVNDAFVADRVLCLSVRVDVVARVDHKVKPLVVVGLLGTPNLCRISQVGAVESSIWVFTDGFQLLLIGELSWVEVFVVLVSALMYRQ